MEHSPQPVHNFPAGFTPSMEGEGSFPVIPGVATTVGGEVFSVGMITPRPFATELPTNALLRAAMEKVRDSYSAIGVLPRPKSSNKLVGIIACSHPGEPDWDAAKATIAGLSAKSESTLADELAQLRWRYQYCRADKWPWHGEMHANGHASMIERLQADATGAIAKFQKLSEGKLAPKDFNILELKGQRVFVSSRLDNALSLGSKGTLAQLFVLYATGVFHAAGFQAASYNGA